MKCQNCGQNEANFFQRSNINGNINETSLCAECAERLGVMQSFVSPIPGIFNDFFSGMGGFAPMFTGFTPVAGFMPRCLSTGAEQAQPAAQTSIKPPVEVDETVRKRREVNMLREQMKKAAESEDFEKAISLREEIKRLEA